MFKSAPFWCVVSLMLVGCGGGSGHSGSSNPSGGSTQSIQGSWEIVATSITLPGLQSFIEADLTQSGNNLSAGSKQLLILTVQGGMANVDLCSTQLSASGSLNGTALTGTLTEGSQSVRITGTLSGDGKSATGTYQSDAGGCTQGDSGTFTATSVSTLSGSFSGTLKDNFNNSAPITVQLSQGTDESFTGSGQITDQGVTYTLSFTGNVIGAVFEVSGTSTSVNGSTQFVAVGHFNPSGTAVDALVVGDTNGNVLYQGSLSKTGSAAIPAFQLSVPIR
jgi:hypothetical protein